MQEEKLAEAREAFEALNEAHRLLRDPGSLVSSFCWQIDSRMMNVEGERGQKKRCSCMLVISHLSLTGKSAGMAG